MGMMVVRVVRTGMVVVAPMERAGCLRRSRVVRDHRMGVRRVGVWCLRRRRLRMAMFPGQGCPFLVVHRLRPARALVGGSELVKVGPNPVPVDVAVSVGRVV